MASQHRTKGLFRRLDLLTSGQYGINNGRAKKHPADETRRPVAIQTALLGSGCNQCENILVYLLVAGV